MKTIVVAFLFTCLAFTEVKAQLFGQQAKKAKLMMEQIAELEVYLHGVKTGYNIAEKGLHTAHDLKNGSLNLHAAYYHSLQEVNPVIAADPKGKLIYELQEQLITIFKKEVDWQQKQKLLNRQEFSHLQRVYNNLLAESQQDLDELVQVLTPGKLQLNDQQRMDRLNHLYDRMKNRQAFAGYFTTQCRKLALERQQALQERQQLQKIYGIN
ncbi:hypothetical protein [Mucilaginibacter lappiensis]|uniref:TerB family tellurite resistance protein n=1 Tax=Mucilaginibacter lappiensis TaxID=354630 RepID=A0A841J8D1_9SPHI|nr:hypothetical protein [Mucilaginibacter lappiensis]MBB6127439.1 hypothetical protein [Mucilaginibacter lappiensis]